MTNRAAPIDAASLTRFAGSVMRAAGVHDEHAHTVAEVLVWADLRIGASLALR